MPAFYTTLNGTTVPQWDGIAPASTAATRGDFVVADGSGELIAVATTADPIVGLLDRDVANSAGTKVVKIIPAVEDIVFVGAATGTPVQTEIWERAAVVGATGAQTITTNGDSTAALNFIGLKPGETFSAGADVLVIVKLSDFSGRA